jgi:hypothetical protein
MICYICNTEYPSNKFCPLCYSEGFDAIRLKAEHEKANIDLLIRGHLQPRIKGKKNGNDIWD